MLTVLGVMAAVVVVMLAFPDTAIERGLHRWLVAAPARALNRVARGKAVFHGLLALFGLGLVLLFEAEGARLFGFMLPDVLVWFAMFDVGVFVDALLITGAILASNGMRAVRGQVSALPRQVAGVIARLSKRARRPRGTPSRPPNETSDEDRPEWSGQAGYLAFSMA